MAGTNWWEVGAQIAVAGGTLTLAGVTALMAKRTHDVAEGTQAQVATGLREAKATESLAVEARTDRQLAWLPQLEVTFYVHELEGPTFEIGVRNGGPGLALQVVAMAREIENVNRWCLARYGDLRTGDNQRQTRDTVTGGAPYSPFEDIPGTMTDEIVVVVVMCSDILGRRFRFGCARAVHLPPYDTTWRVLAAQISVTTKDQPLHTGWADDPKVWGSQPQPPARESPVLPPPAPPSTL